jgi:hypothetical protein
MLLMLSDVNSPFMLTAIMLIVMPGYWNFFQSEKHVFKLPFMNNNIIW